MDDDLLGLVSMAEDANKEPVEHAGTDAHREEPHQPWTLHLSRPGELSASSSLARQE